MAINSVLLIFLSYALGSIPFGYIFTNLFSDKNILEIGWKKTSGSNVLKNVGFVPGLLTALFDIFKGYLAIKMAQYFGEPNLVQALCGVAAVIGHNWSLFLNFNGGRGIGTFGGVLLAFNSTLFYIALSLVVSFGIVWNASIGTILALFATIFYANVFGQADSAGLFGKIVLIPIFLKRLSPIKELKDPEYRKKVLLNRIIFDDEVSKDFRVKRIIKKLTDR
ncbi:MAG: glycerol-3-phosphate acyltransferase [Patescibacteria group bacterium]